VQFHLIFFSQRNNPSVPDERRHPPHRRIYLDGLPPLIFTVGAQVCPVPARKVDLAPLPCLHYRRKEHFISQHKDIGLRILIPRKLNRQRPDQRIPAIVSLAQIRDQIRRPLRPRTRVDPALAR